MDEPSLSTNRTRAPRFSVLVMLYLTACIALSLTLAAEQPRSDSGILSVSYYQRHIEWHFALLSLAGVGVVTSLLVQTQQLPKTREFILARVLRYAGIVALVGLLGLQSLLQRGYFAWPERTDYTALFWEEVFPTSLLVLLLIVFGRSLTRLPARSMKPRSRGYAALLAMVGCVALLQMMSELSGVAYLVHIACSGIELCQSKDFSRIDNYPDAVREGFSTYRAAIAAVGGLTVNALLVTFLLRGDKGWMRLIASVASLTTTLVLSGYCWWYFMDEYPRVSPEQASVGPAANVADHACGMLLLAGLTLWLACRCAPRDQEKAASVRLDGGRLGSTPLMVASIGAAGAGGLWVVESIISYWDSLFVWMTPSMLQVIHEVTRGLVLSPSFLLHLALLVVGVQLCRAWWKGSPATVAPLPLCPTLRAWLWLLTLGAIAVPTLTAYSFSSWLGPWWR